MKDYKQQAKEMAKSRLEKMGGKRSERVNDIMRADGGRVCKADGGSMHDEPDGDEFSSGMEMDGDGSKPRLDKPSRSGGKTTVNIIVGKGQEAPPAPMAMPMPPPPPPGPPPGPAMGPPPGGLPMRASGGRVKKADGGAVDEGRPAKKDVLGAAGAASTGLGAAKYIHEITKPGGGGLRGKLIGAGLGALGLGMGAKSVQDKDKAEGRASGGRMTAGAESGEGRLQKAALARKHK